MLRKLLDVTKWAPSNNKWMEYLRRFLVLGEYRGGVLVGSDKAGNRYYEITEEKSMFPFRNRYVEYAAGREKDSSQIPAEWHGWLHSTVDEPPTKIEYQKSIADVGHLENLSGTPARYAPYNTTRPKIDNFKIGGQWTSFADKISLLNKQQQK